MFADAGSTDGTRDLLDASRSFAKVAFFDRNHGFSGGNNRLAEKATGEIFVFLNNDTLPCDGWLHEIQSVFLNRPEVGIVGNMQLSVSTRLVDHAGVFFDPYGKPFHFRPPAGALNPIRWMPVPAVTGACMAVRRELFEKLGGFDENYVNGYEDTDFCLRAREHTRDILVATRSHIWHYVASSPGRHLLEGENEKRFLARWNRLTRELSGWRPPDLSRAPKSICKGLNDFETVQAFSPVAAGYEEDASRRLIAPVGKWVRLEFELKQVSSPYPLRIDPSQRIGETEIAGVSFYSAETNRLIAQLRGKGLEDATREGGTSMRSAASPLRFISTGNDPQILIDIPEIAKKASGTLRVFIWLRTTPNIRDTKETTTVKRYKGRVLVDLLPMLPGGANGGVKVLIFEILKGLPSYLPKGFEITLAHNASTEDELKYHFPAFNRIDPEAKHELISDDRLSTFDSLYAPFGRSQLSRPFLPTLSVVVDLLHRDRPDLLPLEDVQLRESLMVESLVSSHAVQCNSLFVRESICRHYGAGEMRLFVAYNSLQHRLAKIERNQVKPYFLYPANTWVHKNHGRLLEAYVEYRKIVSDPWDLYLTGHKVGGKNEALPTNYTLPKGVTWMGFLDEPAYSRTLSESGALIFPSLYEGFGIPVLEAIYLSVPVACSNCGSLPEIGGEYVSYFDPNSVPSICEALRALSDPTIKVHPQGASEKLAEKFKWSTTLARIAGAII